jgi:hypothetical protein
MRRFSGVWACVAALLLTAVPSWSQTQSESTVSGPKQWDHQKSTGKSYKKGTKKDNSIKEQNPSTGQTRRLGNTANMTKNSADSGGNRADKTGDKKGQASSSDAAPNSTSK